MNTDCGKVAINVCYDVEFPEMARIACQKGAKILFVPFSTDEKHGFQRVKYCSQARAIENQAYVVGVNRVGSGGGLEYVGDSQIVDPLGEVLASGARTEALLVAEVDPAHVAAVRHRFQFGRDRRTFPY